MKRLLLGILLLVLAVLLTPPLRERAAPHARTALSAVGQRLEGPFSFIVTPYRTLKTQSELSRMVNELAIRRNRGMAPPTDLTFQSFVEARREGMKQDPWGSAFAVERRGDSLYVRSAGPDQLHGTDDDVVDGLRYQERATPRRRPRR